MEANDKHYNYLLSLNKPRIFIICALVFGLFSLFFFIGLVVGLRSQNLEPAAGRESLADKKVNYESGPEGAQ